MSDGDVFLRCHYNTRGLPEALEEVRAELDRQFEKWGRQDHDDLRWLAILAEEVGEASQAILQDSDVGPEVTQVAAVAINWLAAILRREGKLT